MAKPKYVELKLRSDAIPVRSAAGYEVMSDHTGSDGLRHLFLKRPDATDVAAAPKPKQKRKPRATKPQQPANAGSQTAFPGGEVANG